MTIYPDDHIRNLEKENKLLKENLNSIKNLIENSGAKNPEEGFRLLTEDFDETGNYQMYRLLIENMNEGALVINSKRIIVYSNLHFAGFIGYPLQKVIGANILSFLLCQSDIDSFTNAIERSVVQKSFCELTLKNTGPGNIHVLVSITGFRIGKELYHCLIMTDITQQKTIESGLENKVEERTHELAVANRHLTEVIKEMNDVNKYLDNFVHAVAHDLRAPVANLKLAEELLQNASEEEKEKLIASIKGNIDKLDITLKGLVQIIDTQGKKEPNKPDVDVAAIISEVIEEQRDRIEAANAIIDVEKKTKDKINYVEAYIRCIARNLIINALDYSYPERQPRLNISIDKSIDFYTLSFCDNGIGIDMKRYGKDLFKPFNRLSSKGKGMDIGLHIIDSMVQKNGGYISVESKPGEGTCFTFHLKEYHS